MQPEGPNLSIAGTSRKAVLQGLCAVCASASTLLGPMPALKIRSHDGEEPAIGSCGYELLEMLDVVGPFTTLLDEAVRAQHIAHGSGTTALMTFARALCLQALAMEHEGVPPLAIVDGCVEAADICVKVADTVSVTILSIAGAEYRPFESVDPRHSVSKDSTALLSDDEDVAWFFDDDVQSTDPTSANGHCLRASTEPTSTTTKQYGTLVALQSVATGLHHGHPDEMAIALEVVQTLGCELRHTAETHHCRGKYNHSNETNEGIGFDIDISGVKVEQLQGPSCCDRHVVFAGTLHFLQGVALIGAVRQAIKLAAADSCNLDCGTQGAIQCREVFCATVDGSIYAHEMDNLLDCVRCAPQSVRLIAASGPAEAEVVRQCCLRGIVVLDNMPRHLFLRLAQLCCARLIHGVRSIRATTIGQIPVDLRLLDDGGSWETSASDAGARLIVEQCKVISSAVCTRPRAYCPVTVLLVGSNKASLVATESTVWKCLHRLRSAANSGRILPGAGCFEVQAAKQLQQKADQLRARANSAEFQYVRPLVLEAFAKALVGQVEIVGRNCGAGASEIGVALERARNAHVSELGPNHSSWVEMSPLMLLHGSALDTVTAAEGMVYDDLDAKCGILRRASQLLRVVMLCGHVIDRG